MSGREFAVSVNIFTDDPGAVAKACEVLGRAAAGLALEGINCSMSVHELDEDDEP